MPRIITLLAALVLSGCSANAGQPGVGDAAPGFRLQDQSGKWRELSDFKGQWLALYFYPKDDTPGCTTEACAFRDDIFKFRKMNVAILGISTDAIESHEAFAEKYHLPFPLLSDASHSTAHAYGVLRDLGITKVAKRETFLIDPQGNIARHYDKVDPEQHSVQLQSDLRELMTSR